MENNETKINEEMRELTDEELAQVTGGRTMPGAGGNGPGLIHEPGKVAPGGFDLDIHSKLLVEHVVIDTAGRRTEIYAICE